MNRFRTNDEQRPIQIKQRRCGANPDTENLSMSIQQQSSLRPGMFLASHPDWCRAFEPSRRRYVCIYWNF